MTTKTETGPIEPTPPHLGLGAGNIHDRCAVLLQWQPRASARERRGEASTGQGESAGKRRRHDDAA